GIVLPRRGFTAASPQVDAAGRCGRLSQRLVRERYGSSRPTRRECVGHMIAFGETRMRRDGEFGTYYNKARVHRAPGKNAPLRRAIGHLRAITLCPRRLSSPILPDLSF